MGGDHRPGRADGERSRSVTPHLDADHVVTDPDVTLDPDDWDDYRRLAHRMVDDLVDQMSGVRDGPVWQPIADGARDALHEPLPRDAQPAERVYEDFLHHVRPYPRGNQHPRFMGWVNGSGAPFGVLADLLASGMNPSVGAFENAAGLVEDQVVGWLKEMLDFPETCGAVLTSGCSMSTILGLAVARHARVGIDVRRRGLVGADPLVLYTSTEAHSSVDKACELLGFGTDALRRIGTTADRGLDVDELLQAIEDDRRAGKRPIAVIATVGTVNTGAIDDLERIADVCADAELWLHVDGAFGALAWLVDELRPRLAGLQRADSLAFDLHKWLYLPYDIGCVFVRDAELHRATFSQNADYLTSMGGWGRPGTSYADLGIELTRRFRALKAWMCIKHHGVGALSDQIRLNIAQAAHFEASIRASDRLELLADRALNVVCFRFVHPTLGAGRLDAVNRQILGELWTSGAAVISDTLLDGRFALRAAITNHRSRFADIDLIVERIVALGERNVADEQRLAHLGNGHGIAGSNGNGASPGQARATI